MLHLSDGRDHGYMWDTGRKLKCDAGLRDGTTVFFMLPGRYDPIPMAVENGTVPVPDEAWHKEGKFIVFLYAMDSTGRYTRTSRTFTVKYAPKPNNYAYTPTEVLDWHTLEARIEELEGEGLANAVAAYLQENPVEAGATAEEAAQIEQNKEDIATLDRTKLAASELPNAVNEALAQAKASGEFDGEPGKDGADGQPGADGKDYVLTEADKQEIAQEAAGMVEVPDVDIPTTLPNPKALTFTGAATGTYDGSTPLTVNIPEGGGGGEWKLLGSADNLEADVYGIEIETDVKGNIFSVNELYIYGVFITTGTADSSLKINLNDKLTIQCIGCATKNTVTNRGVHIDIVKKAGVVRPSWMMHGGSNTTNVVVPVINKYTSAYTIDQIVGKDDIDEIRKISLALGDSNAFSTMVCYRVYGR